MGDIFQPRTTHLTRAVALGAGLSLLAGLVGIAGASPAQAAAKPKASSKVWLKKNSYGKFELAWKKASKATHYKVIVARDEAMKDVVFTKRTNKLHSWVLDADVKEGQKYYYRIRSLNGKKPGGQTKVGAVRTKVQPVGRPENVVVRPYGTHGVTVRWEAGKRATGYTVKLRTTPNGTPFWSKRTTSRAMSITGLTKKSFFVTVTSDRFQGTTRDSRTVYGAASLPDPGTGKAFDAKVGSYNVMHYTRLASQHPWSSRRAKAASLIDDLDVVGIQESTWGQVYAPMSGLDSSLNKRPIAQLTKLSGLTLAWNTNTAKPCSLHSIHVLYRSSKFSLVSCGEQALSYDERYLTWAVLKDKASGAKVLVVNTHLINGSTSDKDAKRVVQAKQLTAKIQSINTGDLPVIITGDLNSWHGRANTTPLSVLVGAGYNPADLTSSVLVNGQYGTSHNFLPTLKNGIRIDQIFTSDNVLTSRFEVRKTSEKTAPSDHHPVAAWVSVYN